VVELRRIDPATHRVMPSTRTLNLTLSYRLLIVFLLLLLSTHVQSKQSRGFLFSTNRGEVLCTVRIRLPRQLEAEQHSRMSTPSSTSVKASSEGLCYMYTKATTRSQDLCLPHTGRCTQVNLHRIMGASSSPTTPSRLQEHHMTSKLEAFLLVAHQQSTKEASRSLLCAHINVREDCFNYLCTTLCVVTTRRLDCTGSTAPITCIQTRRLAARLLVGRSHWLS
jgi:hypothetical protein